MAKMRPFDALIFYFLLQTLWHGVGETKECKVDSSTLYFSDISNTLFVVPNSNFSATRPLFNDGVTRVITSMSYNSEHKTLLFVDQNHPNQMFFYRTELNSTLTVPFKDTHFTELAFDGATHNVYYITREYAIEVSIQQGGRSVNLIPQPESTLRFRRHHLIVHPKLGLMFWIDDVVKQDVVRMANMDGSEIQQIQSITVVKALALDPLNDYLYMAEGTKISRVNLNTMASNEYLKQTTNFLFYFDCKLIFQNSTSGSMVAYDLNSRVSNTYSGLPLNILAMSAKHPDNKFLIIHKCSYTKCSGLCLLATSPKGPTSKCVTGPVKQKKEEDETNDEEVESSKIWTVLFWFVVLAAILACAIWFFRRNEKGTEIWFRIGTMFREIWNYLC